MNIIQISDPHLFFPAKAIWNNDSGTAVTSEKTFLRVKQALKKRQHQTDLIIASGDLSHEPTVATYQHIQQHFKDFGLPCYCLPGNHDDMVLMRQYLNTANVHTITQLKQQHWYILFLNSVKPQHTEGYFPKRRLRALEKKLQTLRKPILIALHHHPLPIHSAWMDAYILQNNHEFLSLIQQFPLVKAVIFGHVHQAFDETHHNIRFLGCPSTYIQFVPRQKNFTLSQQPPAYRSITLNPDATLTTQVHFIS